MKIKIFLAILLFAVVFCATGNYAMAQSATNQSTIDQLRQEIIALQQLLAQQQGTQTSCYTFSSNLGWAQSGTLDIIQLHSDLTKEGISFAPDSTNTYSIGTSQAVIQFQKKYGISPQSGYVGTKTRIQFNKLYGCSITALTPTTNLTSTTNTNNCKATCVTQSDGIYAVDCSGYTTKCDQGYACQETYDKSYTYNSGLVQTIQNLSGSQCVAPTSSCATNWQCTAWNTCTKGQQTRTCADLNNCNSTINKPDLNQSCTVCAAACTGGYAVDCYGNVTQCGSGQYCQLTYNTTNTYLNGMFYTVSALSGSQCITPPSQ